MSIDKRCPDCGSSQSSYNEETAELVCTVCGLVIDEAVLSDKREYLPESKKKLAEDPIMLRAGGQPQEGKIFKTAWLMSTREKNLEQSYSRIDLHASKLKIPEKITKEAKIIFTKAVRTDLNVGRNNTCMAFGSLYTACLIHELPKTPLEITLHTEVSSKKMLSAYRVIKRELQIKTPTIDPIDLLPRFASRLGLNSQTIAQAGEIIAKIKEYSLLGGKTPQTKTAVAIYLAGRQTGIKLTQRMVTNATGIIEVTIRKRSKELLSSTVFRA